MSAAIDNVLTTEYACGHSVTTHRYTQDIYSLSALAAIRVRQRRTRSDSRCPECMRDLGAERICSVVVTCHARCGHRSWSTQRVRVRAGVEARARVGKNKREEEELEQRRVVVDGECPVCEGVRRERSGRKYGRM